MLFVAWLLTLATASRMVNTTANALNVVKASSSLLHPAPALAPSVEPTETREDTNESIDSNQGELNQVEEAFNSPDSSVVAPAKEDTPVVDEPSSEEDAIPPTTKTNSTVSPFQKHGFNPPILAKFPKQPSQEASPSKKHMIHPAPPINKPVSVPVFNKTNVTPTKPIRRIKVTIVTEIEVPEPTNN